MALLKDGIVSIRPWLLVMLDSAPSGTVEEFQEKYKKPIVSPPNSPHLNPIEAVLD
ncbi:hypothetical protein OnM2_040001 [Erysiphe neolycopersici]|uniref:Uncharacterized protein n=1 Tax=Erysiphe neolycopersici TaxID=212602 RepID=A0A420HW81_9PEZI|nr:hypothetical protein OnM2_040001 [Erysiphe neolycopersici]